MCAVLLAEADECFRTTTTTTSGSIIIIIIIIIIISYYYYYNCSEWRECQLHRNLTRQFMYQ
jgi:hypothetical protein